MMLVIGIPVAVVKEGMRNICCSCYGGGVVVVVVCGGGIESGRSCWWN